MNNIIQLKKNTRNHANINNYIMPKGKQMNKK